MKVSNVKKQTKCANVISKCLYDDCKDHSVKMLTFYGDTLKITEVLGDKVSHNNKTGLNYVGACLQHVPYIDLLGNMMVTYQEVTSDMFEEMMDLPIDDVNSLVIDYSGMAFIRNILRSVRASVGVSYEEICDYDRRMLRFYFLGAGLHTGRMDEYLHQIDGTFIPSHPKE